MSRWPRCDQVRVEANSKNWLEMFILYCSKATIEDLQMAQQMSSLCGRLVGVTHERLEFIHELDTIGNIYAQKTAKYLREAQGKDEQKVLQMRMMVAEIELNAWNHDVFIQMLKGLMNF